VALASNDHTVPPKIDPGFLVAASDAEALGDATAVYQQMQATSTGRAWMGAELLPGPFFAGGREVLSRHCTS